jgi:hypothetical protein
MCLAIILCEVGNGRLERGRLRLNRQKRIELTSPGASLPAGMHRSYRFLRCYCCPHSRFDSSRETLVCFRRLQSFGTCQAPKYVAFLENEKIFCWVIFECAMAPPASRPPAGVGHPPARWLALRWSRISVTSNLHYRRACPPLGLNASLVRRYWPPTMLPFPPRDVRPENARAWSSTIESRPLSRKPWRLRSPDDERTTPKHPR